MRKQNSTTVITDELAWFPDLEVTIDFRGTWRYQMLYPPAFPMLMAWCEDVDLVMEVYPMDPDRFAAAAVVAKDLIFNRLTRVSIEKIEGEIDAVDVMAVGLERDSPTQLSGQVVFDNDTYYVMAFSGEPSTSVQQAWRIEAMLTSATFGPNRSYGQGVKGLFKLVGSKLSESEVPVGYSRGQVTPWLLHLPHHAENAKAGGTTLDNPPLEGKTPPPAFKDEFARLEYELEHGPLPSPTDEQITFSEAEYSRFEASLKNRPPPTTEPEPEPAAWPRPWELLPNVSTTRPSPPHNMLPPRLKARAPSRREWEIFERADELPAEVAFYAEKVHGVGESIAYQAERGFGVYGLERIPMMLEASLRYHQGELKLDELLEVGPPRRALSPFGRTIPDGSAITVQKALDAMVRDDDLTASDLIGWRLGWRSLQAHLSNFGLSRHSMISPFRVQALAFTDLDGPLQGLDLQTRIDLWKSLNSDEQRQLIGKIHKANINTPLDQINDAYLNRVTDSTLPWKLLSRWALAIGPRGTAADYGKLMASLTRGEILSPSHSEWALGRLKPCAGDHLSGLAHGVSLFSGKIGQTLGCLNGAGVLGKVTGQEVAICLLARNISTDDYTDLAEQLRVLATLIYQHILGL